jgi:Xaa-Pro aminopeptidase
MWDKFSHPEMDRRWSLANDLMDRLGLDALLVFGNSGVNRHNEANIFWLSNHLDLHHNYLIAPRDRGLEPALFTGLANHVPNARQVSDIPLIEWGGYNPAKTVCKRLIEIGVSRGRLGLVGVNSKFAMGMPYQHYSTLLEALPNLDLVDVTADFSSLRLVKSEEEIVWLRKAAAFTDRAIYALQEQVRAGLAEYALLGIIEGAYRSAGGQPHIAFLRSMSMDVPDGCLPAQNPSDRRIETGDVIITEISASYWGYSGQIHRPIFVGAEPTPAWAQMFETAREAYRRIASVIRPGAVEGDVIREASVIGENGYRIYDDLIHGYGVDIQPPLIDRSCQAYWPWDEQHPAPPGRSFEKNMAVVIQPNPTTPDERMGLQLGSLTIVTEEGAASLHEVPLEPLIAG